MEIRAPESKGTGPDAVTLEVYRHLFHGFGGRDGRFPAKGLLLSEYQRDDGTTPAPSLIPRELPWPWETTCPSIWAPCP